MATLHDETPSTPEVDGGTLIPEDLYNATAATAGTRTEDLLRYAAEETGEADQIVYLIEQTAQQLAEMGMTLRVVARHLAGGNVPGADRARLQQLAERWQTGRLLGDREKITTAANQRLITATVKACGVQLQNFLDGTDQ